MSRFSWGAPTREVATLVLRQLSHPVDARGLFGANRFWRSRVVAHYAAWVRDYLCGEDWFMYQSKDMRACMCHMGAETLVLLAIYWQRLEQLCPGFMTCSCYHKVHPTLYDHVVSFYTNGGPIAKAMALVRAERRVANYPAAQRRGQRKLEEVQARKSKYEIKVAKHSLVLLTSQYEDALQTLGIK